jgi:hypothetical protein
MWWPVLSNPIRLKASFAFSRSESGVSSCSNRVRSSSQPSSTKRSHGYEFNQCPKKRRLNGEANTKEHDLIELHETNEQTSWQDSSYDSSDESDTCSTTSSKDSLISELMHEQCPDKQVKAALKISNYNGY